ncbi:unnamed protein product [Closterium sp. Naga37s-1]|nr:unnamed protein product [Closterium sp. Naga37s-1]
MLTSVDPRCGRGRVQVHGPFSASLLQQTPFTASPTVFLSWLDALSFWGAGAADAAVAEGLSEALLNVVLVAASPPHRLPTLVVKPPLPASTPAAAADARGGSGGGSGVTWEAAAWRAVSAHMVASLFAHPLSQSSRAADAVRQSGEVTFKARHVAQAVGPPPSVGGGGGGGPGAGAGGMPAVAMAGSVDMAGAVMGGADMGGAGKGGGGGEPTFPAPPQQPLARPSALSTSHSQPLGAHQPPPPSAAAGRDVLLGLGGGPAGAATVTATSATGGAGSAGGAASAAVVDSRTAAPVPSLRTTSHSLQFGSRGGMWEWGQMAVALLWEHCLAPLLLLEPVRVAEGGGAGGVAGVVAARAMQALQTQQQPQQQHQQPAQLVAGPGRRMMPRTTPIGMAARAEGAEGAPAPGMGAAIPAAVPEPQIARPSISVPAGGPGAAVGMAGRGGQGLAASQPGLARGLGVGGAAAAGMVGHGVGMANVAQQGRSGQAAVVGGVGGMGMGGAGGAGMVGGPQAGMARRVVGGVVGVGGLMAGAMGGGAGMAGAAGGGVINGGAGGVGGGVVGVQAGGVQRVGVGQGVAGQQPTVEGGGATAGPGPAMPAHPLPHAPRAAAPTAAALAAAGGPQPSPATPAAAAPLAAAAGAGAGAGGVRPPGQPPQYLKLWEGTPMGQRKVKSAELCRREVIECCMEVRELGMEVAGRQGGGAGAPPHVITRVLAADG